MERMKGEIVSWFGARKTSGRIATGSPSDRQKRRFHQREVLLTDGRRRHATRLQLHAGKRVQDRRSLSAADNASLYGPEPVRYGSVANAARSGLGCRLIAAKAAVPGRYPDKTYLAYPVQGDWREY